jgi:hypothetical protein
MKNPNASTGPRSAEGKARSSMNALKSGIYSKSLTIPGENPARLDTLLQEYLQRFRPALPEQRDLVDILVRSTWTLRRLAVAEAQVWIYEMDARVVLNSEAPMGHAFHFGDRTLTRLQRLVNSTQRNFRDALREIERLQSISLTPEPVSAPGIPAPKPHPAAAEPAPQPTETEPVNPSQEFVSSTPVAAPGKPPKKWRPYHKPGSNCHFLPNDRQFHPRCPRCYPESEARNTQNDPNIQSPAA